MLGHTLYIYAVCPLDNNKRPILIRIIVTFHAKTYYNGFPFSNGIRFRTRLKEICIRSNDLGHLFKKICIRLNGLIARSIETSSRSSDLLTPSIKTSNRPTNQPTFLCPQDKLFKMVQKMQTYRYDKMSTTKGHPWVPQESQDYVLCFSNVKHNKPKSKLNCPRLTFRLTTHQYGTWCEIWCSP